MLSSLVLVALGGALGSVLRYSVVMMLGGPWAVALVNIFGSALMGVFFVIFAERQAWTLLVLTGALGGFTTFSAFSLDTSKLMQSGEFGVALLYVAVSVGLSLIAVALGAALAKGALA